METICGCIQKIRYEQKDTGFAIVDIATAEGVCCTTGFINLPMVGETMVCSGGMIQHPEYGQQFEASHCERSLPTKPDNWARFLLGLKIDGMTHQIVDKLLERWGIEAWNLILHEPLQMTDISGITSSKALQICQSAHLASTLRTIAILFDGVKIPAAYALKTVQLYRENALGRVNENPYVMADAEIGLPFREADRLAVYLGQSQQGNKRLQAAMRFVLQNGLQDGHTCLTKNRMAEGLSQLLDMPLDEAMDTIMTVALETGEIVLYPSVEDPNCLFFLDAWYKAEHAIARELLAKNAKRWGSDLPVTDNWFLHFEMMEEMTLAQHQKDAIRLVSQHGACFITGGPGTGKTTLIRAIVQLAEDSGYMPILAAPTGKAVKRMQAATGYEAKTVHRLLEVGYDLTDRKKPVFRRNINNPIEGQLLIIDEASMVDVQLMAALLEACPSEMRVVLVGDADQLPSVGAGQVLQDCLSSNVLPTVKLERVYRQSGESAILKGAWRILEGKMPQAEEETNEYSDFQQVICFGAEQTAKMTGLLVKEGIPEQFGFSSLQDIQVLTPMRKGRCGVQTMNTMLQNMLNPKTPESIEKMIGKTLFRTGDRVMQTRNDYAMPWIIEGIIGPEQSGEGVFNGDTGQILEIHLAKKRITVLFEDERQVAYTFEQAEALELAFAMTVHKSQGCEYPVVVLPLSGVPDGLATRNLLYTAVTRARKLLVIVGSLDAVYRMVSKTGAGRCTCLKRFLQEAAGKMLSNDFSGNSSTIQNPEEGWM